MAVGGEILAILASCSLRSLPVRWFFSPRTPWVSGSPNQTLAEPQFLQLLCVALSSSAHLAEWYYAMIMGGLWHQARAFNRRPRMVAPGSP